MAKFYCRYCNVSMQSVRAKETHYSSWRHMDMVYQQSQQQFQPPYARTVIVTGFFPRTSEQQLGMYFSRFGRVVNVYIDRRMNQANVEYSDIKEVSHAVRFTPHLMNNRRLMVRAKTPWVMDNRRGGGGGGYNKDRRPPQGGRNMEPQDNRRTGSVNHDKLCRDLNKCQTLEEQLKECKVALLLTEENHVSREQIKNTLEATLCEFLPRARLAVYGSCLSGLALSKANLNLAASLDGQSFYADWPANFSEYYEVERAASTLQLLQAGEITGEEISALPQAGQLSFLTELLAKGDFRRRGMSTLLHQPSGLECVLSVGQGHRIRYSELLTLYVKYEPRVQDLVTALALWARHHGLLNALPYPVLILLVVFHLQVRSVLPTVEALRRLADQSIIVNGVDCSFTEDLSKLPPHTNTQTSGELFKDFFAYYSDYDFTLFMISPHYGQSIFKMAIESREDATRGIKTSPLMIQDPFDLTKNLAENIKPGYLYNLMEKLKVTHERIQSPDFSTKSDNEKVFWGLPLVVMKSISHVSAANIQQQQDYHRRYYPTEITIHMTLPCLKYIAPEDDQGKLSVEDLKALWYEKVPHAIIQYLNKGYLFECEVMIDRLKEKPDLQEFVYGPVENGKLEGIKRPLDENGEDGTGEEDKAAKKPCLDEEAKKEEAKKEEAKKEEVKKEEAKKEEAKKEEDKKEEVKKEEAAPKEEPTEEQKKKEEEAAEAARKKKEEEEKNILFKGLFKVYYRTLNRRKQALTKITSDQEEVEYLEQEHLISVYLAKECGKKPAVSAFEFEVTMRNVQHGALSTLVVILSPKVYTSNFRFMAEMLQVRMSKIVEKILSKVKSKLNQASDDTTKKDDDDNCNSPPNGGDKKDEEQDEQELLKEDGDEEEDKLGEEDEATLLKE